MTQSLRAFSARRIESHDEAVRTRTVLAAIMEPASREWLAGRIATLMVHYFPNPLPPAVVEAMAHDWFRIIGDRPQWAISDGVDWWLGPENKDRKRKPVPGDIAESADRFTVPMRAAQTMLKLWDRDSNLRELARQ